MVMSLVLVVEAVYRWDWFVAEWNSWPFGSMVESCNWPVGSGGNSLDRCPMCWSTIIIIAIIIIIMVVLMIIIVAIDSSGSREFFSFFPVFKFRYFRSTDRLIFITLVICLKWRIWKHYVKGFSASFPFHLRHCSHSKTNCKSISESFLNWLENERTNQKYVCWWASLQSEPIHSIRNSNKDYFAIVPLFDRKVKHRE